MQKAALLHVVRIDYGGTDRLLELEISFSTPVGHAISGHGGSGVENEASILSNHNPNLRFNECGWESGGVADGFPCEVGVHATSVIVRFICSQPLWGSFIIPASLFPPHSTGEKNKHSLDPRREAGDREEESVCVEVLKHALDGLAVDPEGDAGSPQVQTAAHHVL